MSRAQRDLSGAIVKPFVVGNGESTTEGYGVIPDSTANRTIKTAGADADNFLGVALDSVTGDGLLRSSIQMAGIAAVKVAAGGATMGSKAVLAAGGVFQDAPAHDSSGGTNNSIVGQFTESGVQNDLVGMLILHGNRGSA